jgi:aspartate-semialdehyde dehydrogenase
MRMSGEPKGFRIGIAGASGTLGREILSVLSDRRFPIADLKPFASGNSIGDEIEFAVSTCSLCAPHRVRRLILSGKH